MPENENLSNKHDIDDQEDLLAGIRAMNEGNQASAPSFQNRRWSPKEISSRRTNWLVRGLIGILSMVMLVIGYLWFQTQESRDLAKFEGGPAIETYPLPPEPVGFPIPEDEDPPLPEELVAADNKADPDAISGPNFPEPPTPTPTSLPEGVPDIPSPTPSE